MTDQDRLEEAAKKILSEYNGATLFIRQEDGTNNDYMWKGPIPRLGEVIHMTRYGLNGWSKKLLVKEVVYSYRIKEPKAPFPEKYGHLYTEIMAEEIE